jgi:hypothetical protein
MKRRDFIKYGSLFLPAAYARAVGYVPHRRKAFQTAVGGGSSSLLTDLVGYWKLDEASGTRNDSVGTSHLTDNNTVTQAAGKQGNSAQFTASSSEYLSCTDNATLSLASDTSFTIALWAYGDSFANFPALFQKGAFNGNGDEYILYWHASFSTWRFLVGNGSSFGTVEWSSAPATSTWYFIVCWHDAAANTINIQVNDGTTVSAAWTGGTQDTTSPLHIGRGGTSYWNGRIDEVGFWKRVLTSAERTALYNSSNGVTYPFS